MLFENAVTLYLADKREGRRPLRANTIEGYESAIRAHLTPRWGGMELECIDYASVQSWVDGMGRGALKAYKTLRQIVRWCIARRHVTMADPTVGVDVRRPPRREAPVLSAHQLNRMLYACRGEAWEAVVWCQACLGLRRCEACALTWADVDLRSGEVSITKGRHVVRGRVYVWGTKTAKSTRTVVLPRFAVARLREIRKERRARPSELLCDLRPDAISRRFRAWCRRHGLAGMSMMQLRHTWATLSVAAGVPIEVVAMALGHAGIGMAYERYVTRSVDLLRASIRRFADAVLRAAPHERLERALSPALVA